MAMGQPSTWIIKVTRAFWYNGEPKKVGTVLTVPAAFGSEVVSFNKAERVYDVPVTEPVKVPSPKAEIEAPEKTDTRKGVR